LLLARGVAHSKLGQHKNAEEDLRAALDSSEIPQDVTLEAMVRLHEGLSLLRRGLVRECQECLEAATLLVEAAGVADKHPRLTLSLGACHETLGDFEAAEALYKKALQQAESNQNQRDAARIHSKMGTLCGFQSGREAESREHLELARTVGRDLGERIIEASATYNLGRLAMNQDQREEAHRELRLALSQFQEMGDLSSEGMVALSLGLVLLEDGDLTSARARIGEAERALSVAGSTLSWIYAQATLALADLVAEDTTSAQIRAEMAAKRAEEMEHDILKGICVCVLCFVSALGGDPARCADYADEANRCLEHSNWAEGVALNALVSHFRALSVAVEEQERLGRVSEAVLLSLQAVAREIAASQAALPARARVATRLLGRALGDLTGQAPAMPPVQTVHALQVEREGRWFHAPDTSRVDISRRRTLRPLLVRLVQQRLAHPGEALSIDDLFCAAWPGERILEEAKKNRVYVAVATLRRAGLDRYIDTRSDGYLLRQDVEVNWAAD
jgi:tetratricopeptide (TPR) repeat protein